MYLDWFDGAAIVRVVLCMYSCCRLVQFSVLCWCSLWFDVAGQLSSF